MVLWAVLGAQACLNKLFEGTEECAAAAGRAGCQCLPVWSYTSSKGVTYTVSNGTCQNPGGEWNTFWCYVDQVNTRASGLRVTSDKAAPGPASAPAGFLTLCMHCCLCAASIVLDPRLS